MSGRMSRNKGKAGELELSKELTRLFGVECRRGQQFNGIDGRDVVGLPGVHIECKRVESLRLYDAVEQATQDAGEDETPLVCHRKNGKEWLAIVPLDQLPALASKLFLTMAEEV